ncbi:MAG: hypothetical protein ACXABY_01350 [Candidatus Thorarchaeota archaeon]
MCRGIAVILLGLYRFFYLVWWLMAVLPAAYFSWMAYVAPLEVVTFGSLVKVIFATLFAGLWVPAHFVSIWLAVLMLALIIISVAVFGE